MCPVIERSLNKAGHHTCQAMASKKNKLEGEAKSEILVADTDSESVAEASAVEDQFEEEEEEQQQQQQQQASASVEPQAATSGELTTWGPPHERTTNIHLFSMQQKV